ncbi:MAG TPA: sigma 54-interacting transcriptional regulator [Candidatus Sulfopaludibacter sp.]|jgi:formate hydrogenlyase transcriptional activator|nr:sigma 54-interacting transcriptional regulator [Candidatus Sulfopaludibacter sp.]
MAGFAAIEINDDTTAARYESLIRLAESIRGQRAPRELFDILVEELRQIVPFDAIAQFDEGANKVHWHLCRDCGENHSPPLPKEQSLAWWVHQNQQAVVVGDVWREDRFPLNMEVLRQCELRSICAVPLTTAHRRLGSIAIASHHAGAYTKEEVRFVALVAAQIALAMDDAMNFEASRRAQERLELLLDLTNRFVSNLDLREVLREIAAGIRRVMQCDGVSVALPDPDSHVLRIFALDAAGSHAGLREGLEIPVDKGGRLMQTFESGQAIVLNGAEWANDADATTLGMQPFCHLPLTSRDRVLGILSLGSQVERTFSAEDVTFLRQVANQVAIAVENALAYGQISDLKDRLAQEKLYLEDEIRSELNFEEIVGKSEALRYVLKQVETVAPTDSTVLIYGETGTGKELVARALHNLSGRSSGAFVKLNCAAIPTGLLESELFGHEKGAFTGAISQRVGRFELAHRGSVFLDEVGEIPLELQPKLLRVLQEREFERLGSSRTLRTDARLIAATNRDLAAMVDENKFRSDLYYRLNVFPIRVPSLRERPVDIPLLVRHFVQQFSRRLGRHIDTIPSETMEALVQYHWPGNIRELQNVLERAVIVSTGPVLRVSLEELRPIAPRRPEARLTGSGDMRSVLDDTERQQIETALEQSGWVVAGPKGAAAVLGMKRSTLQARMQKLGISASRARRNGTA